jgi:hypothetical protein
MNEIRTGRALQLEGIENARNKVTLGFKVDGGTKILLAKEASEFGISLSEYIDTLIAIRHEGVTQTEIKEVFKPDPKTLADLAIVQNMYQNAINKVKFYENDFLQNAFKKYQGQTVTINENGIKKEVFIDSIEVTYNVLINTLKLKENV